MVTSTIVRLDVAQAKQQVDLANESGLPLLICLVATKACFIKFSGFVRALIKDNFPFLALESGQHYDKHLTTAADELDYRHLFCGSFYIRGDLTQKSSSLQGCLSDLYAQVMELEPKEPPLLVVCGDTLSAGIAPFTWYLLTGRRSVHLEAGLRSMRPKWEWCSDLLGQRIMPWTSVPTRPFPEGMCTRLATCVSQQLLAPVQRNVDTLLAEGHEPQSIHLSGSPSVDALELAKSHRRFPAGGKRLRVDVHRRENLNRDRLESIFNGLVRINSLGIPVEFVITNSMRVCESKSWHQHDIKMLESHGILTSPQWDSYIDVVSFLMSPDCLGIYTDSGGLQEEACILGVPCMTCRFDTDRIETVVDFKTNLLIPPLNGTYIADSVHRCLTANPREIWPGLGRSALAYGSKVGANVVSRLKSAKFEPPTSNMLQ